MEKLILSFKAAIAFLLLSVIVVSCGPYRVEDLSNISDFHKSTAAKPCGILKTGNGGEGGAFVDMYIDYSDCMTSAKNSEYFNKVQPAIIACAPNYYSIKGESIKFETNDKMEVHRLLNSLTNINYSNIKGAVDSIIMNKREAILITDGEYYQANIGANLNNPYLADEFKAWLDMGLDIYIYCEPYMSGKHTKNRYYMLFTDHRIDNNIQEIFSRNAPKQEDVTMVHLYSGVPKISISDSGVEFNEQLMITEDGGVDAGLACEYHIMDASWNDVYDYILNATDDNGKKIPGGDFFLRGLRIDKADQDALQTAEIEVRTYEISNQYDGFSPKSKISLPSPLKDMFVIDSKAWKKGDIVLKLSPNFDGSSINDKNANLLRIDICVKQTQDNFSNNSILSGKFVFDSPYGENTSIFESLKQTMLDPSIRPENSNNSVIYTFYLSSFGK